MDEEIYVSCHAPSLSFLLYETARSVHDQKGLLIGQICNEVISKKTDENELNREHKTAIYLEHCIPLEDQDIIGNGGLINKAKLQKYIDILHNKIVGWYSFRRNTRLVPNSLSEMLIHQALLELLPNAQCQYFVACFMSSNVTANMSTHIFNHIFMTFDPVRARFEPLRLKIYTLSDKSVNSNGYLMKNPFPTSASFDKIIKYVQKEETPVKSVLAIRDRVKEVLDLFDKKMQNIETHRMQLEREVEALKKKLALINNQEIFLEEPEERKLILQTLQFDPQIKYNSNRKTNPLQSVQFSQSVKPVVPNEKQEEKRHKGPPPANKPARFNSGKWTANAANEVMSNCDGRGGMNTKEATEERDTQSNTVQKPKFTEE